MSWLTSLNDHDEWFDDVKYVIYVNDYYTLLVIFIFQQMLVID